MPEHFDHLISLIHKDAGLLVPTLIYPQHHIKRVPLPEHILMASQHIKKLMIGYSR